MNVFQEISLPDQLQRDMVFFQNNQPLPHPLRREHWHHVYEILYVRRGWGEIRLNADIFPFCPGDVILIRPGDVHSNGYSSPDGCDIDVIQFVPSFLYHDDRLGRELVSSILHPDDARFQQLFNALKQYAADEQPGQEQLLAGLVHLIIGLVLRTGSRQNAQPISAFMQNICAYLEESDDLRLASVAAHFSYSPEHLSRRFHTEIGVSYRQWCSQLRMERAALLLANEARTVAGIAEALGYSDASSFIRAFKQNYGITPSAYRRRQRIVNLSVGSSDHRSD